MAEHAKLLELAGSGLDLLGLAAGCWYVATRYRERVIADADRNLSFGASVSVTDPVSEARPDILLLRGESGAETDEETDAEGLLAPQMAESLGLIFRWWERGWRNARTVGWPAVVLCAPVGLVLLAAALVWSALLLPVVTVRYLSDTGKDFRLRIAVLAFAAGIVTQILGATIG
ncbi:hypothetical protein EAS64_38260 [Trebonia kvetii]|uniref:Uncharacterized protein n=1 Tax=Trebonia kvetii TaxID=2480626 RepID=A0A6P2BP94_9ACTN|nr:hypothetical protein [Trebonia kvetii]TVZ00467.1 hypothetical protein EAS64_38260 [Trebonia kvetii]